MIGKFGECTLAARLSGIPPRESAMMGAIMNTRGLKSVFFMPVAMAVVTTYIRGSIAPLEHPKRITQWWDRREAAVADWEAAIQRELDGAQLIMPLLDAAVLAEVPFGEPHSLRTMVRYATLWRTARRG